MMFYKGITILPFKSKGHHTFDLFVDIENKAFIPTIYMNISTYPCPFAMSFKTAVRAASSSALRCCVSSRALSVQTSSFNRWKLPFCGVNNAFWFTGAPENLNCMRLRGCSNCGIARRLSAPYNRDMSKDRLRSCRSRKRNSGSLCRTRPKTGLARSRYREFIRILCNV